MRHLGAVLYLKSTLHKCQDAYRHDCSAASPQEEVEEGEGEEVGGTGEVRTGADAAAGEEAREEGLHPQDIDGYWLQRQIANAYQGALDADAAQKLAEKVFAVLEVSALGWQPETVTPCCKT